MLDQLNQFFEANNQQIPNDQPEWIYLILVLMILGASFWATKKRIDKSKK